MSGPEISTLVHIIFGFLIAGAVLFQWRAVFPAVSSESGGDAVREAIRKRWAPIAQLGILVILVTGIYQFMEIGMDKANFQKEAGLVGPCYHMLFGIKFLFAMGFFFIAAAMSGRSEALAKIREAGATWAGLVATLLVIGILVITRLLVLIPASG